MERIGKERMSSRKPTRSSRRTSSRSSRSWPRSRSSSAPASSRSSWTRSTRSPSSRTSAGSNALGPGGLSRDRAGFEVRDVHYTHYGRMCPSRPLKVRTSASSSPLPTTRGSTSTGSRDPVPQGEEREGHRRDRIPLRHGRGGFSHRPGQRPLSTKGEFQEKQVSVRKGGDYITRRPEDIQYMDVSPKQIISVSASLIPFLEHDDANRALMGSNMQRQAVPLISPEPRRVGTGMEGRTAYDSGVW